MRCLVQRVSSAKVSVAGEVVGLLDRPGLLVFVGVTPGDGQAQIDWMVRRLLNQQVFEDGSSVLSAGAPLLVVSQFTLYGSVRKGRHPSWTYAAPGEVARPIFEKLVADLRAGGAQVQTGVFGAMMQVSLVNEGQLYFVAGKGARGLSVVSRFFYLLAALAVGATAGGG